MKKVTPVILCGGSGTRLWPLSRKSYPKQFAPLIGEDSLFQATAQRLSPQENGPVEFTRPVIVTNADFRFIVTEQMAAAGIDPGAILIEPARRNTAPAILAAAIYLHAQDPEAILLVSPSDHSIPDTAAFQQVIAAGLPCLDRGQLVLLGIQPDRAETGYGYLELDRENASGAGTGSHSGSDPAAIPLKSFVEKPDADTATRMLQDGRYLWNAGIFLFRAADILTAYEQLAPDLVAPSRAAVSEAETDLGFLRLAPEPWAQLDDISIDYAVMEKAQNLMVVPYCGDWSDLGDWSAVWRESTPDADGIVTSTSATAIDCSNTILRVDGERQELVGIGLDNIIAVAMNDAVLVADKSRAQEVSRAVSELKARQAPQAETFPKDHRPWGWFESLVVGPRFQVKRILVHPGQSLSLQSHFHRSEHWIVVTGTAKVTIDDTVRMVAENESVYVPLGAIHRLENPGKIPVVVIEVQTGSYVGEDDIIRYEDIYARRGGTQAD